jgi:drug/metabolite transporter superfamily protein YnfA
MFFTKKLKYSYFRITYTCALKDGRTGGGYGTVRVINNLLWLSFIEETVRERVEKKYGESISTLNLISVQQISKIEYEYEAEREGSRKY